MVSTSHESVSVAGAARSANLHGRDARAASVVLFGGILSLLAPVLSSHGAAGAQSRPQIGLSPAFAQLHQEQGSYPHAPGAEDHFGFAVAAGDFNGDGFDDLATGVPENDCDFAVFDCGSVQVRFGWTTGALGGHLTLDPNGQGPSGELPPEPAGAFDRYGAALAIGDFQNDGYDDLVVGVPGNFNVGADGVRSRSGAVHVHYGLPGELGSIQWVAQHSIWQGHRGDGDPVPGDAWPGEQLGSALAVGDFDGDGHDDLAIGDPFDACPDQPTCGNETGKGSVLVGHGRTGGLVPFDGFLMYQGLDGLPDVPEEGEQFGYALAAGDFDGDGFDDLAIGVPSEDDVGAVLVVYGSPVSLIFPNHLYFGQFDLNGTTQPGARFGEVLAAGDFNGDGYDDLAVGAPRNDGPAAGQEDAGRVAVLYGAQGGLLPARHDLLTENSLYGSGAGEAFDSFGSALAAGDFDGDGIDDLAIGTSGEDHDLSPHPNTGAVSIVMGHPLSLHGVARRLHPRGGDPRFPYPNYDFAGMIPSHRGGTPFWGGALATGDFDGNGFSDLAIGASSWTPPIGSGSDNFGAVAVLFGQLFVDGFETADVDEWTNTTP